MTMTRGLTLCRSLLLLMVVAAMGFAKSTPLPFKPAPVPGGVAVVAIKGKDTPPKVTYHAEPVLVRRTATGWQAVVGIPLSAKPGQEAIEVDGHAIPFTLLPKRYPEQRLRLENKRHVNPNPEDEARITREEALIKPAWKAWPEGFLPSLVLLQPTPGSLTASFGMRRILNGEARAPHPGLDIKAPQGRAVRAPAAGVVVLTGNFFFAGNAVFLAHGEGMVSLLCHLSKISVKQGQVLKAGDLLGEVGATGRATGPHLHWSLSLNNARVDPKIFLKH